MGSASTIVELLHKSASCPVLSVADEMTTSMPSKKGLERIFSLCYVCLQLLSANTSAVISVRGFKAACVAWKGLQAAAGQAANY